MNRSIRRILPGLLFVAALLLAACEQQQTPVQPGSDWQAGNLRGLVQPDAPDPNLELIAAYARLTTVDLELRFDLLGSPGPFDFDLYLALDTGPDHDGTRPLGYINAPGWDLLLHFPARGLPRGLRPDSQPADIRPRILRDGVQDSLTARISRAALSDRLAQIQFWAFLARPGESKIVDQIGPFLVGGVPSQARAPVALVFWDTLPSATPAQALRRWDGAHTGPYGQRHGLNVLLQAAARSRITLTLLDLKEPARLSALDALGGLPLVRDLQRRNLLLLPDLVYGDPQAGPADPDASRRAARQFGLATSRFFSGPLPGVHPADYQAAFAHLSDPGHIRNWSKLRLVPLPEHLPDEAEQAGPEGLTVEARLALLQAALSPDPGDLVVLGGSLPSSPWGDSLVAGPALAFLAGHPWIEVLDEAGLLAFPAQAGAPECPDLVCALSSPAIGLKSQARTALEESPSNLFSQLAWQTYRALTDPGGEERLAALQANYLGQTGILLAASEWAQAPGTRAGCDQDLDWDGEPECVLASDEMFLVFETQGARLVLAAARTGQGLLQWIAPRSQFTVGLGDPFEWRPGAGLSADPEEVPGAFAGPPDLWVDYQASLEPGLAVFTEPFAGIRKAFRLDGLRLLVSIDSSQPSLTALPLTLLTGDSYTPGWYRRFLPGEQEGPSTFTWGLAHGPSVHITGQAARLTMHSFAESLPYLDRAENPDFGYPPGHFIPFAMAVVEIQSQGSYHLEITIEE